MTASLESRGYMDNMTHSSVSSDGDLFHADVTSRPAPCQRGFGSMRSVSTSSPLPNIDSPVSAHSWLESGSNTPLSYYTPQPSPPPSLSTPNAHSSPRALPSSLDVGNLELSLLEAMEGLESLGLNGRQPPLLPQKRRGMDGGELSLNSPFCLSGGSSNNGSPTASSPSPDSFSSKAVNVKFVQDTSKFWYKPDISREQAIALLKDKEPGAFIVRDSHSFRGAYGLAMKVATPPPSVLQQSKKVGDLTSELVRHFLIECTQKGVRLKGCPNEPYFGSLTALVCQHSITPLALPCKLIIPDRDPLEELNESQGQTSTNSATELLKQGAACNVWFLGSVELESLTGVQAVQKATTVSLSQDPPTTSTIVHFKVSAQGITLTDNQRKLFFRRHYPVNTVIFCALDPQDRKWTRDGCLNAKIFGFVARKSGSNTGNVCHLFAEHDPEQPASAIVNFVSKVMIGSQKAK
ncbi:hypothetical protein KOW79_020206 [Hemibagrus wyckioides]|uniref:Tensin 3 n=1 Tax=Hemibagrus wyckioides TaxID=337641 RepID=A0A9D3N8W7_9TELE|nr:hypothetical protein KOW79_020206 [Hemibagrus wyckioides]